MALFTFEGAAQPALNVLADRYVGSDMQANFSDDVRIVLERDFWTAMMEEQAALGVAIPETDIADYHAVRTDINKDSMRERERISRHDVNARLEEFNALAGHQHAQKGMTSRDLTENVEQLQIRRGLDIIADRSVATLGGLATMAAEHSTLVMAGRSHNVAAQTTTLGKRFANVGQELLYGYSRFENLRANYPLRGVKGPVGTQQDMLDLFGGDAAKVDELERRMAARLGFEHVLGSVGQIYPRSLDFDVVSALKLITAAPANFAKNIRLMAGHELVTEGFQPGQVGSNAMPHKMNARTSERIGSLYTTLSGYVMMAAQQSGDQWNEGDVSCSAARRVFVPDAFYAADGMFQSTLHVMKGFGVYPAVVHSELYRYLPFLTTTKALMAAVKAGAGREDAHHAIRDHAVAVALKMREQGTRENDLFDRLAADDRLPLSKAQLEDAIANPIDLTGMAERQVANFVAKVETIVTANPEAAAYQPEPML